MLLSSRCNKIGQQILVLCDLHFLEDGQLNIISTLEYDFCVLLGDIPWSALQQIKELVTKPIFAVGGNHDTREMYKQIGIPYLNGKCAEVNGWRIAGVEGSSRYKNTKELVMLTQEESLAIAEQLPKADILISHDSCFSKYGTAPNKCGLKGIDLYIERNKPILHLHGHHHIYDKYMIGETLCLCCYRCMLIDTSGDVRKIF